jgi:hypothetical protein
MIIRFSGLVIARSLVSFAVNIDYFIPTNAANICVESKVKRRGVFTLILSILAWLILRVNPPYPADFFGGLLSENQKLLNNCYNYD